MAKVIFKAATDESDQLRYPVQGRLALMIHAILPEAIWGSMLGVGIIRRPKDRAARRVPAD